MDEGSLNIEEGQESVMVVVRKGFSKQVCKVLSRGDLFELNRTRLDKIAYVMMSNIYMFDLSMVFSIPC